MKTLYILGFLFGISPVWAQNKPMVKSLSVYVLAHPDDLPLYMGVEAYDDILGGMNDTTQKLIFIYLTSSDSDTSRQTLEVTEMGARESVHFVYDHYAVKLKNIDRPSLTSVHAGVEKLHGKIQHRQIPVYCYKNTSSYFVRLPDDINASGKTALERWATGVPSHINTVNEHNSPYATRYASQADLESSIRELVTAQISDSTLKRHLYVFDPFPEYNPGDQADHYLAAKVGLHACKGLNFVKHLYEGDGSRQKPDNMLPDEVVKKSALYTAYFWGKLQRGDHPIWGETKALGKHYRRVLQIE
jgi:hypothetical protein